MYGVCGMSVWCICVSGVCMVYMWFECVCGVFGLCVCVVCRQAPRAVSDSLLLVVVVVLFHMRQSLFFLDWRWHPGICVCQTSPGPLSCVLPKKVYCKQIVLLPGTGVYFSHSQGSLFLGGEGQFPKALE